ncbi:Crp/Fnr family transcriptional regulator [Enterococcus sp. CSURQ0835]|uniref:Crp/Fnr family transcriptional regulator n=1 Tax=Enterococcus sp. CSURQ0835 TaxID=2681394 RepID=UPI00135A13F1|nr:Crp/Fnr family transcriptional regulator [Enterococcus sp. CSURQ0835]
MKADELRAKWQQYGQERLFNYLKVKDKIGDRFLVSHYEPNDVIVTRGDFPTDIYFLLSGVAVGTRDYEDGNEYDYFQLDKANGSIGLLEILAQKETIIATVTCLTKVDAVRVPAAVVYDWIMNDLELLRLSANLLADDLYRRSGNDGLFYRFEGVDRVRHYLVAYYEEQPAASFIEIHETREKIANKLGLSVRTVGRALKKLREHQEVISHERKLFIGEAEYARLQKNLKR